MLIDIRNHFAILVLGLCCEKAHEKTIRTGMNSLRRIHRRSGESHRLPNAEKLYAAYLFI